MQEDNGFNTENNFQQNVVYQEVNNNVNQDIITNKKTKLKISSILILLLILVVISVIVYVLIVRKDSHKEPVTKDEKFKMVSIITDYNLDNIAGLYKDKSHVFSKPDNYTLELAIKHAIKLGDDSEFILQEKVRDFYKDAFNISLDKYPSSLICELDKKPLYTYSKESNAYIQDLTHPSHDSILHDDFILYHIVDAFKVKDEYKLDVLFLYGDENKGYFVNGKKLEIDFTQEEDVNPSGEGEQQGEEVANENVDTPEVSNEIPQDVVDNITEVPENPEIQNPDEITDEYIPVPQETIETKTINYFVEHRDQYIKDNVYEYTFKKDANNNFYLYSISVINNK